MPDMPMKEYFVDPAKTKKVVQTNGRNDLENLIQKIASQSPFKARLQEDNKKSWLPFFSKGAQKPEEEQAILHTNGGQKTLIITNGKDHYTYDVIRGAAATQDLHDVLGTGLHDVSGPEARENLQKVGYDVSQARKLSQENLNDLEKAIQYAYKRIIETKLNKNKLANDTSEIFKPSSR